MIGNEETVTIPTQAGSAIFQNIYDEIEAMDKIKGLEVSSDGGFIANYNDRHGMRKMEEKRKINKNKDRISLKEETEIKMKEMEENKDEMMTKTKNRKVMHPLPGPDDCCWITLG